MAQLPLFVPSSNWVPPTSPPDIRGMPMVALDTETKDNGLAASTAPGWATSNGHICGVSAAWDGGATYLPVRHPETECLDPAHVFEWVKDLVESDTQVVFHNAPYDMGWLGTEGVPMVDPDRLHDTMAMAVLLDENQSSYSLDNCCARAGIRGKSEGELREAAATYGIDAKAELWKLPAKYVGAYAEQDAVATLALARHLLPLLRDDDLMEAYALEMDVTPVTMEMRRRGVRVDLEAAERAGVLLDERAADEMSELARRLGLGRVHLHDVNSPAWLERVFDAEQIPYPRTPKSNRGSFRKDWLESHGHWLPQAVTRIRSVSDAAKKFVRGYIIEHSHMGRIHPEIHQLRDDRGGTRTYRLSYSNPPLQQIPARDPVMGPLVRGAFLPEDGERWLAADYSQQEPRLTVHFAAASGVTGADVAVDYYTNNEDADYHTMVAEMFGQPRKHAKTINLGLAYGMGVDLLAAQLGVTRDEAQEMLREYHERVPFVGRLSEKAKRLASRRGFVRLLDGRKCRFDLWEPRWQDRGSYVAPMRRAAAEAAVATPSHLWVGQTLVRANTRKAMNRLIQGSAAVQTKMAMRDCYAEGHVPLIQMHDELGFSVGRREDGLRVCELMRDTVGLRVPVVVDEEYGANWGNANQTWREAA